MLSQSRFGGNSGAATSPAKDCCGVASASSCSSSVEAGVCDDSGGVGLAVLPGVSVVELQATSVTSKVQKKASFKFGIMSLFVMNVFICRVPSLP